MPGTYSQIQIQVVFAVKGRRNLVPPQFQPELNKYIAGIITAKGQKPIIVNGVPDHIHVFFWHEADNMRIRPGARYQEQFQ